MKKFFLCIAALFSLTLCFGFKSAAYTGPTGATYQYEYVFTEGGSTLRFYSNYLFFGCSQETNNGRPYLCAYIPANSNTASDLNSYYVTDVTTGRNTYYMDYPYKRYPSGNIADQNTTWTTWAELKYNNGQSTANWRVNWTTAIFQAANVPVFSTYAAAAQWANEELQPDIDWDTVYYSANILPPELDITYRELSSVPIVDVPLNVDLIAEPQNVYVEIGAVFECPDEVDAYSDNGVYTYHALDTLGFAMTIIDKEDLFLASNASSSYIHLALNEAWQDVYDQIPISDITWYTDPNYSNALVNNMKSRFENLRKVCCFYGNELKLFVRYFVINNDTQFVVGSWRIWNSRTPNSFTDQTPTWYQPYIQASGTTGTSSNTASNTQQDPDVITIPPGSGDPTGIYYIPDINISVGSNVPNYPDYPTIRSYNADNFLVKTMNYLDYFDEPNTQHDIFGQFGNFCQSIFLFIPGEIWSIIALGFCLVIVVMFLKIL